LQPPETRNNVKTIVKISDLPGHKNEYEISRRVDCLLGMNTGAVASTRAACAKQASDPNGPLDWRDEEAAWLCNKVSSSSTTPVILSCAKYLYDPNGYNLNSTEATRFVAR